MKEIVINGETGYIKINYSDKKVEIKSSGFTAKGMLSMNSKDIQKMREEFNKCIECKPDEYYKALYTLEDEIFGIELRCDGESDTIHLLSIYNDGIQKDHRIEFEFLIRRDNINKVIESIDYILNFSD